MTRPWFWKTFAEPDKQIYSSKLELYSDFVSDGTGGLHTGLAGARDVIYSIKFYSPDRAQSASQPAWLLCSTNCSKYYFRSIFLTSPPERTKERLTQVEPKYFYIYTSRRKYLRGIYIKSLYNSKFNSLKRNFINRERETYIEGTLVE